MSKWRVRNEAISERTKIEIPEVSIKDGSGEPLVLGLQRQYTPYR